MIPISIERMKEDLDNLIKNANLMAERANQDRSALGIHADNQFILSAEEVAWSQIKETLNQARLQLNRTGKVAMIGQSARAQPSLPDEPRLVKNQQDGTEKVIRTRDLIPAPDDLSPPTQGKRNV